MPRVLVAVDETEDSVRAAEVAHRLFGDDAEYLAVSVADIRVDPTGIPWWGAGWGVAYPTAYGAVWPYRNAAASRAGSSTMETAADAAADDARAVAERSGLPAADAVGELGDPASAILRAAENHQVDVIVLGTHERGWFDRILNPSVSKEVVKQTDVPVLVVP